MADKWLAKQSPWAKPPKRRKRKKSSSGEPMISEKARRKRALRIKKGEEIDRRDREVQRGMSVRTVSGGLPTLGRHNR